MELTPTQLETVLVSRFHLPDPDALPLPGGPETISPAEPAPKQEQSATLESSNSQQKQE